VAAPEDAYGFGRNWQEFVSDHLTPDRVRIARDSVARLVGVDLTGKHFLDIGSGSGLFSLAAHELGAGRVVSIDVDPDSVASTRALRERAGAPESWTVLPGSILDAQLVNELEPADVVYSWGVLHHTGDMWTAIENAAKLVQPGGRFVMAIYNDAHGKRFLDSHRWVKIKRFYNRAPRPAQAGMELAYRSWFWANELRKRNSPIAFERDYRRTRGMAFKTDVKDWLGGYPYEFSTAERLVEFCEGRCGLKAVKVNAVPPKDLANHELVFERPA
jgi:2-polyprenyl-6-hydroxyphenyl methylase/3-demethylubiquinone-9 3-methyltransferase